MAANTLKRLLTAVVAGTETVSARSIMRCTLLWLTIPGLAAAQTNQTSPNFGSVPSGTASSEVLHLTLRDAIIRALRYNLGQIESGENARIARGQRLRALSALLPQVSAGSSESVQVEALGLFPRWCALALFAFLLPATFVSHSFWLAAGTPQLQGQLINFSKNVAIWGGLIFIAGTSIQPSLLPRR